MDRRSRIVFGVILVVLGIMVGALIALVFQLIR